MGQNNIIRHKQVIIDFLEDYRREFDLPLAFILEIAELALQEGRVGVALSSYNESLHQTPKADAKGWCRECDTEIFTEDANFCQNCGIKF